MRSAERLVPSATDDTWVIDPTSTLPPAPDSALPLLPRAAQAQNEAKASGNLESVSEDL